MPPRVPVVCVLSLPGLLSWQAGVSESEPLPSAHMDFPAWWEDSAEISANVLQRLPTATLPVQRMPLPRSTRSPLLKPHDREA